MEETKVVHKKKVLAPKLRFSGFEKPWIQNTLGGTAEIIMGQSPDSSSYNTSNTGLPLVQGNADIIERLTTPRQWTSEPTKVCDIGDLILTVRAPVGAVAKSVHKACIGRGVCAIRSKKDYSKEFLYQFLFSYEPKWTRLEQGSTFTAVNGNDIKSLKLNIPSLPEQEKIAAFLTAVDEKIQQLNRKKQLLEQYKKGVMQQLFSGKLRFKDENGKAYPKWEEKKLGEIAEKNSTKNKGTKVNFVLTNSATKGIVSQDEYFDREIANQGNLEGYYIVSINDFVYNPRISVHAPVGPIKRNKLKEGVMSPLYSVFKFKVNDLEFFEYYFETEEWHEYLKSVSNSGARHDRMNILSADFFKMPIPFPCEQERKKIADFLSAIDVKINGVAAALEATTQFKKGLLQQMFV